MWSSPNCVQLDKFNDLWSITLVLLFSMDWGIERILGYVNYNNTNPNSNDLYTLHTTFNVRIQKLICYQSTRSSNHMQGDMTERMANDHSHQ
jgi:hypothetical protein